MKVNSSWVVLVLVALPIVGRAEWISETDKRYQKSQPAVYAQVAEAKRLIDNAEAQRGAGMQALQILGPVLDKDPKFIPGWVQLARLALAMDPTGGNNFSGRALEQAEEYLANALEIDATYDYALAMMGYVRMYKGKLNDAGQYYRRAMELHSNYPYLKVQMAQLATRRGDFRKAIEIASQNYEENKSDATVGSAAISEILDAYRRLDGDHSTEMTKWHERRTTLEPSNPQHWEDYSMFKLRNVADYEAAIRFAQKSISLRQDKSHDHALVDAYYVKWAAIKDKKERANEASETLKMAEGRAALSSSRIVDLSSSAALEKYAEILLDKFDPPPKVVSNAECERNDEPIQLSMTPDDRSVFDGTFHATYRLSCDHIDVDIQQFRVGVLKKSSGRIRVETVRLGFSRPFEGSWIPTNYVRVDTPNKVIAAGEPLPISQKPLRINFEHGIDLSKWTFVIEVAHFHLDSDRPLERTTAYFRSHLPVAPRLERPVVKDRTARAHADFPLNYF